MQKRLKYLMMVAVAGIWGYVIYQYFIYVPAMSRPVVLHAEAKKDVKQDTVGIDTFSLISEYRDPFLARTRDLENSVPVANDVAMPVPMARPVQVVAKVNWRQYRFMGMVNETGREGTGLLQVNGKLIYVVRGEVSAEMEVVGMWADSIRLRVDGETQTVRRR